MTRWLPSVWLLTILPLLLTSACGTTRRATPERPTGPRPSARLEQPAAPAGLYAADEALRDALSSPLSYLGTGEWHGIHRLQACAFRNQRVIVVNVYCSITETQAFRIDVYSPSRGRVRIYAESQGPVSAHARSQYFTFMAESEPPPAPEAHLPRLALSMSFAELRSYDELRYRAYLPACYGGQERHEPRAGCLGPLAPRAAEWMSRHRPFLANASDDWYRLVRDMRALAGQYGREPQ